MSDDKKPLAGLVVKNSGSGIGIDIVSTGTAEGPSIGLQSLVYIETGNAVIGASIEQSGPGIGMQVVQNGPGVGFSSVVVVGKRAGGE